MARSTKINLAKLRELRVAKGLSQDSMAAALGCRQCTYNRYETGVRAIGPDELFGISRILSVPVDDLFLSPGPSKMEG